MHRKACIGNRHVDFSHEHPCSRHSCKQWLFLICFDLYGRDGALSWSIGPMSDTRAHVFIYIHQKSNFHTPAYQVIHHIHRHKRELTTNKGLYKSTSVTNFEESIKAHSHPDGIYKISIILNISPEHTEALRKSSCRICTYIHHSTQSGIPLQAISFKWDEWCRYFIR